MSFRTDTTPIGRALPTIAGLLAVIALALTSWVGGWYGPMGPPFGIRGDQLIYSARSIVPWGRPRPIPPAVFGAWRGNFGNWDNVRIVVQTFQSGTGALLTLPQYRETFRVEATGDDEITLFPISVKRSDGRPAPNYSPDSVWLTMSADGKMLTGRLRNAAGSSGLVTLRRAPK